MKLLDLTTSLRKRLEPQRPFNYFLVILLLLSVLSLKYLVPAFDVNEAGKLISVRQLVTPDFLSHDWAVAKGHGDNIFDFAFAATMAPLWVCLHDMLWVAMVARALFWIAFLLILVKLGTRLQFEPYVLLAGTAGWILLKQHLGTSEWILGGIEPKCFSYALLLLALIAIFDKATLKAGIYCGLAISFHVLVGFWGTFALAVALLMAWRDFGWRRILTFGLIPALINLPLLIVAHHYDAVSTDANRELAAQIGVLVADPLHVDPYYFHGAVLFAILVLLTAVSVWLYRKLVPAFEARVIGGFLSALALEFGAGLIARPLNNYRFLLSFPFRVADTLVLFFFLLALTCWAGRRMLAWCETDAWKRIPLVWKNAACIVLILAFAGTYAYNIKKPVVEFTQLWQKRLDRKDDKWREMTDWVRSQTPKDAVFLSPPWLNIFWIDGERAQVVNYKRAPHNSQIIEWQHRLEAVNGGPVRERGYHIMDEMKRSYPYLSTQEINAIRDEYGASYYLTTVERKDLQAKLVHANGEYFLYRL